MAFRELSNSYQSVRTCSSPILVNFKYLFALLKESISHFKSWQLLNCQTVIYQSVHLTHLAIIFKYSPHDWWTHFFVLAVSFFHFDMNGNPKHDLFLLQLSGKVCIWQFSEIFRSVIHVGWETLPLFKTNWQIHK